MVVNPAKFPRVKADLGQIFVDWIVSKEGQDAIAGFTLDGAQVFFPNADSAGS
jgi:tungstate transport system substrate-binding protein